MSGIPKPMQLAPRQSKKPPCSCDLRLASRIASYSGVSGACWPLPQGLVGSSEGWPPKLPMRSTPRHCPFHSGYFISSPAAAVTIVIASAATSGTTLRAKAPIVRWSRMFPSHFARTACFAPTAVSGFRLRSIRATSLLPRLLEIAQVRRRLVLLGGHQKPVAGNEIILLADKHVMIGLTAIVVLPQFVAVAPVGLRDRPRPRQRVVDRGDLIVQEIRIVLVEINPLQDDRLVVRMQRQAAVLVSARPFEVAGFHFERVIAAIAVGIEPFADRVALIARLLVWKLATVRVDAARHEGFKEDVGDFGRDLEGNRESRAHDPRHVVVETMTVGVVALAAGRLVLDARFQDGLEFRRQRRLLAKTRRLGLVPLRADTARPLPLATPIGIFRLVMGLCASSSHTQRRHHGRADRHPQGHEVPPLTHRAHSVQMRERAWCPLCRTAQLF